MNVLEQIGLLTALILFCAYGVWYGWLLFAHHGIAWELVSRALHEMKEPTDPILAKRHKKLLKAYRVDEQ